VLTCAAGRLLAGSLRSAMTRGTVQKDIGNCRAGPDTARSASLFVNPDDATIAPFPTMARSRRRAEGRCER
jgi:hypothetical protein